MKRFVAMPVWTLSWVLLLLVMVAQPLLAQERGGEGGESTPAKEEAADAPSVEDAVDVAPPQKPQIWADNDFDHDANSWIRQQLRENLPSAGLDFLDTPLGEIVDYLRDEYELVIQIDEQGLGDLGLGPDEPVSVNLHQVKLGAALQFMLKPLELTTVIKDGMLIITSEDEALTQLRLAVYPVADLLSTKDNSADELIDIIISSIAIDTWAENGGGEAEIRFHSQRGALVISQMEQVHSEIISLLNVLRSCDRCNSCTASKQVVGLGGGGASGCSEYSDDEDTDENSRQNEARSGGYGYGYGGTRGGVAFGGGGGGVF